MLSAGVPLSLRQAKVCLPAKLANYQSIVGKRYLPNVGGRMDRLVASYSYKPNKIQQRKQAAIDCFFFIDSIRLWYKWTRQEPLRVRKQCITKREYGFKTTHGKAESDDGQPHGG